MTGSRPVGRLLVTAALVAATPVLAACGTGRVGAGGPLPYVAEFRLGWGAPEEQRFVLTPAPGPRVQVLPEPSHAPPVTPSPDHGEPVQTPPVAPPPDPGGWPSSFEPSVAWVDGGRYLGVVTYGSGSCPSGPHGIEVVADQEIEIRLGPLFPGRDVCSADVSGHVTVVELPQGVTPAEPLVARFGEREVTIPAVGR